MAVSMMPMAGMMMLPGVRSFSICYYTVLSCSKIICNKYKHMQSTFVNSKT